MDSVKPSVSSPFQCSIFLPLLSAPVLWIPLMGILALITTECWLRKADVQGRLTISPDKTIPSWALDFQAYEFRTLREKKQIPPQVNWHKTDWLLPSAPLGS